MLAIRKILVPTDLSPSAHRALIQANRLAEGLGAQVHALHVLPLEGQDPVQAFFRRLVERPEAEAALQEEITSRIEEAAVRSGADRPAVAHVHVRGTHAAAAILDYARSFDADLIVMGTHGHRSLEHPGLGGTAGEVVRRAPCPVMTVRAHDDEAQVEALPVRRLLVPVDFSEPAERAVPVAKQLAALYGAALVLLFVAEERTVPVFSDTGLPTFMAVKLDPEIVSRADEALQQLLQRAEGPEVAASCRVRSGSPASEILAEVDEQEIDLVVISPHGQAGSTRFSLGSTSEKVVRKAPCPVLTLRPDGKALNR